MSRIDITTPLNLLAIYTQAMILSLIWKSEPSRVYVVGFGGGRIPMVLHHHFPNVRIESTDIEPAIVDIAQRYFGITFDDRLKISIKDGRDYLTTRRRNNSRYDLITLDGFRGIGYGPYRLSTLDFYYQCTKHLTEEGVVVANLLGGDKLYTDKIKTFCQAFPATYLFTHQGADVMIGTISPKIGKSEIIQRASCIQKRYQFEFPLDKLAHYVLSEEEFKRYLPDWEEANVLTDAAPPPGYFESLSPASTIFKKAKRNDPCPCGSGKIFEQCHSRLMSTHKNR